MVEDPRHHPGRQECRTPPRVRSFDPHGGPFNPALGVSNPWWVVRTFAGYFEPKLGVSNPCSAVLPHVGSFDLPLRCSTPRWALHVRIRLNQVKAKANYYIGRLYILSRMSMRILQVNYGDCAIRPRHGLKQEKAKMRKGRK